MIDHPANSLQETVSCVHTDNCEVDAAYRSGGIPAAETTREASD